MALSREEQQRLEELEALLAQDDPKLAHTLRGTRPSPVNGRRAALGGVVFVAGIGLLVVGMQSHWSISVVGFVVMLAAAAWLFTSRTSRADELRRPVGGGTGLHQPRDPRRSRDPRQSRQRGPKGRVQRDQSPFMEKLEDRWRRRQQGGL